VVEWRGRGGTEMADICSGVVGIIPLLRSCILPVEIHAVPVITDEMTTFRIVSYYGFETRDIF
jgi:hypothetical protein